MRISIREALFSGEEVDSWEAPDPEEEYNRRWLELSGNRAGRLELFKEYSREHGTTCEDFCGEIFEDDLWEKMTLMYHEENYDTDVLKAKMIALAVAEKIYLLDIDAWDFEKHFDDMYEEVKREERHRYAE